MKFCYFEVLQVITILPFGKCRLKLTEKHWDVDGLENAAENEF